ncbi:MAG: hypothetical protein KAQ94_09210 [Arcobacteraceae bacterium]|nr:hypothetical protein [Arcobacteraceae bacterium]
MIHINCIEDIEIVDDKILQEGLRKEFERLPVDFEYPLFGYFIIIDSLEELKQPIPLKHGSINQIDLPISDSVEMIEEFDGYSQIVCVLYADFGVSLFVRDTIATHTQLEALFRI